MGLREEAIEAWRFDRAVAARNEEEKLQAVNREALAQARDAFEAAFGKRDADYWVKSEGVVVVTVDDLKFLLMESWHWEPRLMMRCALCQEWYDTSFPLGSLAALGQALGKVDLCDNCEEDSPTMGDRLEDILREIVRDELPPAF
jgi:hypothetical protein